ncbi:SHPS1 phosphatase, partial [Halcyon senegalensis]|nr:SHPS1 phosphatase [Halcyon senegalensis]
GVQAGWSFRLQQPQDKVSVRAGETLTLTCTTSGSGPPGPVKWLKDQGSENKTIYDQKGSFPRVMRVVNGSNTDFSIRIRDVQPEDSGIYYCVKFSKSIHSVELFARGEGTVVSLYEPALVPGMVAAVVVLCSLLLLGLFVALCMYWRKRRGEAGSQRQPRLAAVGSFLPIPLRCCSGTPGTPSDHINLLCACLQQRSKEDNDIHYADLQPLPVSPPHGRSPSAACSEYASVRVDAK